MAVYIGIMIAIKGIPTHLTDISSYIDNITAVDKGLLESDVTSGFDLFLNLIDCICLIFFVGLFWNIYDKKPI